MGIKYRHEWKHVLNTADLLILRQRLRAVMEFGKEEQAQRPGDQVAGGRNSVCKEI